MTFEQTLDKYKEKFPNHGRFTLQKNQKMTKNLCREKGVPEKPGVYLIYSVKNDAQKLLRIGTGVYDIWENVQESGGGDSYPHYAWSGYCEIKAKPGEEGKWWYSFEDLDPRYNQSPDDDRNEPTLLVERLDNGDVRVTIIEYCGGYYVDFWFGEKLLWEDVNYPGESACDEGEHIHESKVVSSPPRLISIDVKDPRVTARWTKNVSLD